jgi:hypothetical protein
MKALTTLVPADTFEGADDRCRDCGGSVRPDRSARWGNVAVATGRGNLVYRNADGSTRVSNDYSFNVFEQRNGRWMYAAALLPWRVRPRSGSTFRPSR